MWPMRVPGSGYTTRPPEKTCLQGVIISKLRVVPKGFCQTPGHAPRSRVHSHKTPDRRIPRDQDAWGDSCKPNTIQEDRDKAQKTAEEGEAEGSKSKLRSCDDVLALPTLPGGIIEKEVPL